MAQTGLALGCGARVALTCVRAGHRHPGPHERRMPCSALGFARSMVAVSEAVAGRTAGVGTTRVLNMVGWLLHRGLAYLVEAGGGTPARGRSRYVSVGYAAADDVLGFAL